MVKVILVSLAVIVVPLAVGACVGRIVCRWRGGRVGGLAWLLVCILLPLLTVPLYRRFPVVGVWDAGFALILLAIGIALTAHRLFARGRDVLLATGSFAISLLLLEVACRWFLPASPVFATAGGTHLFLADALQANPELQPADTRSKEIVCSVVYGDGYPGLLSLPPDRSLVLPQTYRPRDGATRRVLHIGDSMVFGLGVGRDETFTAALERLEPGVEHINGGIPGIAPDAYLALIRRWLATQPIDAVVMYPFEGNDIRDVDGPYPCCDWQSLLSYDNGGAALRCAQATAPDLSHSTWTWLRYNSPPPYVVRALIGHSVVAAYLGAAMVDAGMRSSLIFDQSDETRFSHIEAIFRAAREELDARGVRFFVVALPMRNRIEHQASGLSATKELVEVARRAGAPAVDASDALAAAAANGHQLFLGSAQQQDIHFNVQGHDVLASWLHEQLRAAWPPGRP